MKTDALLVAAMLLSPAFAIGCELNDWHRFACFFIGVFAAALLIFWIRCLIAGRQQNDIIDKWQKPDPQRMRRHLEHYRSGDID